MATEKTEVVIVGVGAAGGAYHAHTTGHAQHFNGLAAVRGQSPQRGRWLVGAIGVLGSGPRGHEQQVPVDGERRCGVSVRAAGKSACGSFAGGIDFPDGADVLGALVVEFGDGGYHPRSVRRNCQARNTWQREVVIEVVECRYGHESLVTQRAAWCDVRFAAAGQFDFQTRS